MLQTEIETLANIIEAVEKAHAKHWYDRIIMKIVIFILITLWSDNTIVMDQIAGSREKGASDLSREFGNWIAKVANEIPDDI